MSEKFNWQKRKRKKISKSKKINHESNHVYHKNNHENEIKMKTSK